MLRKFSLLAFFFSFGTSWQSYADCISLIKGYIALDVRSCGVLKPEMTFDTSRERYSFIKDLPPREQKRFWHSYKGMIVKGQVAKSQAKRSGLTNEKGALGSEVISAFVHPGQSKLGCRSIKGKRIKAYLEEACCEGGGDPPCLLNSAYTLNQIKVLGKVGTGGSKKQAEFKKSKKYLAAHKSFNAKRYKKAIKLYQQVLSETGLDIKGLYHLAFAYRQEDRCNKAIKPLREIASKAEKKDYWSTEEPDIRKATFLLARCYSKLNKPGFSTTILQAYLLEPYKYRQELRDSLNHKDFGWIRTSKEYQKYRKEAERKLKK